MKPKLSTAVTSFLHLVVQSLLLLFAHSILILFIVHFKSLLYCVSKCCSLHFITTFAYYNICKNYNTMLASYMKHDLLLCSLGVGQTNVLPHILCDCLIKAFLYKSDRTWPTRPTCWKSQSAQQRVSSVDMWYSAPQVNFNEESRSASAQWNGRSPANLSAGKPTCLLYCSYIMNKQQAHPAPNEPIHRRPIVFLILNLFGSCK